jgi:hypothetical protein
MKVKDTLKGLYSFPGFEALSDLNPHLRDPEARIVTLQRHQKKISAPPARKSNQVITTVAGIVSGIYPAAVPGCMLNLNTIGSYAGNAAP